MKSYSMESAPKDGSYVGLWYFRRPMTGRWCSEKIAWEMPHGPVVSGNAEKPDALCLIGWFPLPDPPQSEQEGG